jgi:hypothetical protein
MWNPFWPLCAPATVSLSNFARESLSAPLQMLLPEQILDPLVKEHVTSDSASQFTEQHQLNIIVFKHMTSIC